MKFLKLISILTFFAFFNKITIASNDETIPSFEGSYGDWKVFKVQQNNQNVCYAVSTPKSLNGNHRDDREPYIMVSFFGKVKQEISISAGYFYRPNSVVSVSIDGIQERFIAENDTLAWPEKHGSDKQIINEMVNSFKILVFSESNASTYSVDIYSLNGFKKAFNKIKELCGNK